MKDKEKRETVEEYEYIDTQETVEELDLDTIKLTKRMKKMSKFFEIFGIVAGSITLIVTLLENSGYMDLEEFILYLLLAFFIFTVFYVVGLFLRVLGKILVKVSWISNDLYDIKNKK